MPHKQKITRVIMDYLNSIGGCAALELKQADQPTVMAAYRGRAYFYEIMSRPTEDPTSLQLDKLQRWCEAAEVARFAWKLDDVKKDIP